MRNCSGITGERSSGAESAGPGGDALADALLLLFQVQLRKFFRQTPPVLFAQFTRIALRRKLRLFGKQPRPILSSQFAPVAFLGKLRLVRKQLRPIPAIQFTPVAFVLKLRLIREQTRPISATELAPVAMVRKLRLVFKQIRPAPTIQLAPVAFVRKLQLMSKQPRRKPRKRSCARSGFSSMPKASAGWTASSPIPCSRLMPTCRRRNVSNAASTTDFCAFPSASKTPPTSSKISARHLKNDARDGMLMPAFFWGIGEEQR